MDVGPQPKLGLLLSLTVMNLVAIGICICAPSPNERKSSFDDKKAVRISLKKRAKHSLNGEVETIDVKSDEIITDEDDIEGSDKDQTIMDQDNLKIQVDQVTKEEHNTEGTDYPKEESEIFGVIAKPPTVEESELGMLNDRVVLEENKNNLNVITINKNFGNDSSKEGSETSLNDLCGYDAEMRYLPQDLGKSVTAVLTKSFQLIDTFNTKVVPALENFNEQISKTAHLERSMDANVVGTINSSICPAVIRMSDSINRMHEKINRVTEKIHITTEPKERSVSCQVSESLLVKSFRQKNSFFSPIHPRSEAKILNLFGHISCKIISRRKDGPLKTPSVQYWANRKKTLMRKFKTLRCKNLHLKPVDSLPHERSSVLSNCSDVDGQLRYFEKDSREENMKEETASNEPSEVVDLCNNDLLITDKRKAAIEENGVSGKMALSSTCKQEVAQEEPIISSFSYCSVGMRTPSLPVQLPSYLSSYDEFSTKRSSVNYDEPLPENKEPSILGEERIPPGFVVPADTDNQSTSFIMASEFTDEKEGSQGLTKNHDNVLSECGKSLHLSKTVKNTIQKMRGSMSSQRSLQDILDMLDPNAERNTVENLFLLILKIFDTWSESQLSVVPSRAISRLSSPSNSTCISLSMGSKLADPFENSIESANEMYDPAHYYSCIDTVVSCGVNNMNEESDICQDEEEMANEVVKGIVDEALSRTPQCTEIEVSRVCPLQNTSTAAITYNPERQPKALLYKEQYAIARKITAECTEAALSTSVTGNAYIQPSHAEISANTTQKNSTVALRVSSEESFYSWTQEGSSDDYSYYECDGLVGSLEPSEKSLKRGNSYKHNLSKRNLIREQEKSLPLCQEVKESKSDAHCSTAYYLSRPSGSAVIFKSSSIESWMLNSTSGDGAEIWNTHSELKSEEMSDLSSRPMSFTTDDMSDGESNHSFASESSKDFQIRRQKSSRLFGKLKKKRPKTPKTTISAEAPSHAQSDYGLKVAESHINRNASLSDEN